MNGFFANILQRHLGTGGIVTPRCPSRFETDVAGFAGTTPMGYTDVDSYDTEVSARRDGLSGIPEKSHVAPPVDSIEPLGDDMKVNYSPDPSDHVNTKMQDEDNLLHTLHPSGNDTTSDDEHTKRRVTNLGPSESRLQDRRAHIIDQKPLTEERPIPQRMEQSPTAEIERRPTLQGGTLEPKVSPLSPVGPPTIASESDNPNLEALENRINSVFFRLQKLQSDRQPDHSKTKIGTPASQMLADLDSTDDTPISREAKPPAVRPVFKEVMDVDSEDREHGQQKSEATVPPQNQGGTLEPPVWVSRFQTDLNRRSDEQSSKRENQQVVNVTIGRIEVRAVPADVPPIKRRKKKHSRVMSLDSYLTQRKSKG